MNTVQRISRMNMCDHSFINACEYIKGNRHDRISEFMLEIMYDNTMVNMCQYTRMNICE